MTHTDLNHSESPASAGLFAAQNRFDGKSRRRGSRRAEHRRMLLGQTEKKVEKVIERGRQTRKFVIYYN